MMVTRRKPGFASSTRTPPVRLRAASPPSCRRRDRSHGLLQRLEVAHPRMVLKAPRVGRHEIARGWPHALLIGQRPFLRGRGRAPAAISAPRSPRQSLGSRQAVSVLSAAT